MVTFVVSITDGMFINCPAVTSVSISSCKAP